MSRATMVKLAVAALMLYAFVAWDVLKTMRGTNKHLSPPTPSEKCHADRKVCTKCHAGGTP